MRHFEQSLQAVSSLDVDPQTRFELIGQIDDYVFGFALREAQEMEEHERGWPPEVLEFFQREIDSGDYPLIRDFLGDDADAGVERVVEYLGKEGRFERPGPPPRRHRSQPPQAPLAPRGTNSSK